MFGQNQNQLYYDYTMDFNSQFPLPETSFQHPPLMLPHLSIPEHDSISTLRSEVGYTSSGCSSYGGSPSSITQSPTFMQRSISSHSLHHKTNSEAYSPMNSSAPLCFYESETSSVRKALSAGDLHGINMVQCNQRSNSPLANETSIIESMINKASPYSPEEKKERIERYRNKKNLRNFNKKIKYECRKTLADSRPRIRGRFARNDEIDKIPQSQWDPTCVEEEDEEEEENWIHFLDSFSANLMP